MFKDTLPDKPASAPVSPDKATPKQAPKPVQWKLYKGEKACVPGPGGVILEVTNENLNNPKMIIALTRIEADRGVQLFGKVFVKK